MQELLIKIGEAEKTEQDWFSEFNSIGRPEFYKIYGVLNKRELVEIIEKAKFEERTKQLSQA